MAARLQVRHGGPLLLRLLSTPARTHNMLHTRGARWQSASHQPQSSFTQPSQASNEAVDTPEDSEKTPCVLESCISTSLQPDMQPQITRWDFA